MLKNIARALGGDPQKRELERLSTEIEAINSLEREFENLSAEQLQKKTDEFRNRLSKGETLDDILPEAFAVVREASKRTTGLRHFDIQLIGGIVLHEGKIAEMRTGEGKTLVATMPLYLNALTGKGAHLVTVNDYLARRDARWMAPIYDLLGLSVGVLQMSSRTGSASDAYLVDLDKRDSREEEDQLRLVHRREAYQADITYGTNNEFGFDYLRDNLVMDIRNRVQRGHHYAIIDEVDNILIDEARTPLIISGPASEDVEWYNRMAAVVRQLEPEDYDFDEKDRSVALTEIGEAHVEDLLKIPLRDPDRPEDITPEQARLLGHLEQALRAELLFKKNKDYIVQNGEVVIVDEFTGRLMPGRRWSEGLHQAVEAKEGVEVNPENVTHATITLQNYFRKYDKLAGMTGTAVTEAEEFATIYELETLEIPTNLDYEANKPESGMDILKARDEENYEFIYYALEEEPERQPIFWKRKDYPDVVYRTEEAKLRAIVEEILRYYVIGRPQLVGTTSIEHSERLSGRLKAAPLQRLLTTILIRQAYFRANNMDIPEQSIPELEFLNQPLDDLNPSEMRQFAKGVELETINPENEDNLQTLLDYFDLDEGNKERLIRAIQGGIPHQVLNALKHDQESQIIAGAGAFGAVTIATNMAGRGVDIKLGGEIEEEVLSDVRKALNLAGRDPYGMTNSDMAEALKETDPEVYAGYEESVNSFFAYLDNMRRVREVGGLHVIGSERHEARRIDNQLRGRSARQGDPGSSRFYLSLEDDLMRMFGGDRAENLMRIFNLDPSIPLESRMLGRLVEGAQERVEGYNFDVRKHLLEYDDVLNDQRERIYSERDRVLVKEDLEEDVLEMLRTELQRRIPDSLMDPEGPWKLLAFLDEIQPTIFYPKQDERIFSYTQLLTASMLAERAKDLSNREEISHTALGLAREAITAEKVHVTGQTRAYIQRTAETFQNQLDERKELLDIFIDNASSYEGMSTGDLSVELQNLVRIKMNISRPLADTLQDKPQAFRQEIAEEIQRQLLGVFLNRLTMVVERRAGSRLALDTDALLDTDWPDIEDRFVEAVEQVYDEKSETLTREGNQIHHNIGSILERLPEGELDLEDLAELTAGMRAGTQMMIDTRTHQRINRRVNLINYVFLAAGLLEDKLPEVITEEVLEHLESVQQDLRRIWGKMELQRWSENTNTIGGLDAGFRQKITDNLESGTQDEIKDLSIRQILEDENEEVITAVGKVVQTRIYRHILLREISDLWIEHLTQMEALRVSIRMEAYAQQDPLVQYKSQSTDTFTDLLAAIRMGVISKMFRLQPAKPQPAGETPDGKGADAAKNTPAKKKKRKRHKKR